MGPFDLFRKRGSKPIQAQPLKIRKQLVVTQASKPSQSSIPIPSSSNIRASPSLQPAKNHATTRPQSAPPRVQKSKKRPSPAQAPLESDSDDDSGGEEVSGAQRKRAKLSTEPEVDTKRQIRNRKAFLGDDDGRLAMVHAADIASLSKSTKYKAAFPQFQSPSVSLQYPSASQAER